MILFSYFPICLIEKEEEKKHLKLPLPYKLSGAPEGECRLSGR